MHVLHRPVELALFVGYSARLYSTVLVGQSVLCGKPAIHQVAHKSKHPLSIRQGIEEVTELSPREHAVMETDQGDPLRLAACPAQRLQRLFAIMEMLDHRGLLRNKGLPIGLYITRRLPALLSG